MSRNGEPAPAGVETGNHGKTMGAKDPGAAGIRVGWVAAAAVGLWLIQAALEMAGGVVPGALKAAVAWPSLAILPALPFLLLLSRGDLEGLKLVLLLLAFSPLVAAALAACILLGGGSWDLVAPVLPLGLAVLATAAGWMRRGQRVRVHPGRGPAWVAGASLAGALAVLLPILSSHTARASFHGFLHTSIAYAIVERGLPAENPFFAGQPLPYYWIFHVFGALLARCGGMVPLDAFAGWNLQALAATLPWLAIVASSLHETFRRQALGAVVALLGLNVFGWIVFVPRVLAAAGHLDTMAQPLHLLDLLAMGWDYRINAPLTKFCNVSSFPASFVLVLVHLYAIGKVVERPKTPWAWVAGAALLGATALSPHLGGFVGAASLVGLGAVGFGGRRRGRWGCREVDLRRGATRAAIVTGLALICVLPYLVPILRAFHLDAIHPAPRGGLASRLWGGIGPILVPLVLAAPAIHRALREGHAARIHLLVLGAALLCGHAAITLPEDTQYKVVRLAVVPFGLLAGEAASRLALEGKGRRGRGAIRPAGILVLAAVLLPTTLAACWVYARAAQREGRVAWQAPWVVPRPGTDPKEPLYRHLREHAPEDAIVVVDPTLRRSHGAGRLQGNEVPLYARLAIYTDRANYLTEGYPSFPQRKALVQRLYGEGPGPKTIAALRALGRPVYLIRTPRTPRGAWDASRDLIEEVDLGSWGLYRLQDLDGGT